MFHSNAEEWIYNEISTLQNTALQELRFFFIFLTGLIIHTHAHSNALIADSLEQWKTKQILNL